MDVIPAHFFSKFIKLRKMSVVLIKKMRDWKANLSYLVNCAVVTGPFNVISSFLNNSFVMNNFYILVTILNFTVVNRIFN